MQSGNSTRASNTALPALTPKALKYAAMQTGHFGANTPSTPSTPVSDDAHSERAPRRCLDSTAAMVMTLG